RSVDIMKDNRETDTRTLVVGDDCATGQKHHCKSTKHQTPTSREAPSAKSQSTQRQCRFGWDLGLGLSLELGAWILQLAHGSLRGAAPAAEPIFGVGAVFFARLASLSTTSKVTGWRMTS